MVMEFVRENISSIFMGVLVFGIIIVIVIKLCTDKKTGRSACSACKGCNGCDSYRISEGSNVKK